MYFLQPFGIKNFNHTPLCILPGNKKFGACNFCNEAGNFLGHLSIGQVCFKLCSCPAIKTHREWVYFESIVALYQEPVFLKKYMNTAVTSIKTAKYIHHFMVIMMITHEQGWHLSRLK